MNTKLLMTATSLFLGVAGLILSFLPQESASFLGWDEKNVLSLQMMGALYFGFAMINWTAKANLIGGIYGRPIAIGNFTHFMIAAIALFKFVFRDQVGTTIIMTAIFYLVFAILFGYVLFSHPSLKIEIEPDDIEIDDFPKA